MLWRVSRGRVIKMMAHSSRPHDVLDQTGPEFELQRFPIMTFRPTFGGSGAAVSAGLSFFRAVCFNLACDCVFGRPGRYRGPQAPSFSGIWWRGDQVDSKHNIVIYRRGIRALPLPSRPCVVSVLFLISGVGGGQADLDRVDSRHAMIIWEEDPSLAPAFQAFCCFDILMISGVGGRAGGPIKFGGR